MVAMVPLLTPISGYNTTFYNHIAMVLTPLRDHGKTMAEPHSILQGKHAKVRGVSRGVEVKKMTRVILRISRTDYREWRWKTVPTRIVPVRRD